MIYLDHNATTPLDERVLEAMLPFQRQFYGNPSSLYKLGRLARSAIDMAREQVAALAGAQPSEIIFTSGGTEANNLAFTALKSGGKLAISAIEHPSVSEPAQAMADKGCDLMTIAVDPQSCITEDSLDQAIASKPQLISIMLANNETGVIQDIASIALRIRNQSILFHTDAVQALGKIPTHFNDLGVDLMTLSSHKLYGPKGCGALVARKSVGLQALNLGGGQEHGLRAGTENVAAIIGFGKAAELARAELAQRSEKLLCLKELLETSLLQIPGITIFAQSATRLPNTVQFSLTGMDGEMLLMALDRKGIAVSSGSACASGGGKPSPVLKAMGVSEHLAKSAIRVSLGHANTEADIIEFIKQLKVITNN